VRDTIPSVTRQESETELAGKLAASLTPRIQQLPLQQRGEQNSGLFDIGAMYAASVEQVMRRAQKARQPVFGIASDPRVGAPSPFSPPVEVRREEPRYTDAPVEEYEEVDLAAEYLVIPGLRPRGHVGGFAVAVAWLATATLAAGVATMVPAHGLKREVAPVVASISAPAPATTTTTATTTATATTPATTTTTTTTTATLAANLGAQPPKAHTASPTRPHPIAHLAADAPAASPPPVAKAPSSPSLDTATANAPAPKATAPKPAVAAAAPAPAAGGGSLEDLIRQAVAADAKKH
jgi:hypothetical protein